MYYLPFHPKTKNIVSINKLQHETVCVFAKFCSNVDEVSYRLNNVIYKHNK